MRWKRYSAREPAEQIVVEHQPLFDAQRAARLPYPARPEDRRLRQAVSLPDLEHAPVAFKCAGMFNADEPVILVDEPASAHDDVTASLGIYRIRHRSERPGLERVIGIEEAQDLSCRGAKALVDRVGLTAIRFTNRPSDADTVASTSAVPSVDMPSTTMCSMFG